MKKINCVLIEGDLVKATDDEGREFEYTPYQLDVNGVKISISIKKNSKDLLTYLLSQVK